MENLKQLKEYFKEGETNSIGNEVADYRFVRRADGPMFQYTGDNDKYTFYKTLNGFLRAALYRIKRG